MNSCEPVGESLIKVVRVSPDVISQTEETHDDDLMPVEPGVVVDDQVEGQEVVEGEDYHDEDGAVHFGREGHEGREARLPPGVPVPSMEMIRKHRKAGHCPYRPWCAHCVKGAANAPGHKARNPVDAGGTPEVHCDYAFSGISLGKGTTR